MYPDPPQHRGSPNPFLAARGGLAVASGICDTTPSSMSDAPTPLSKPVRGQACSCGSGNLFEACCEPVLTGARIPATAEELMRARFTAHVAGDHAFLHRSYQGTARQPFVAPAESGASPWTRLVVHAHEVGPNPDSATVDFTAHFIQDGLELAHQEKAEFHRIDGAWIYIRALRLGPAPRRLEKPKVGRNDPCPCGSGKKYKHCCGK